MAHFEDSSRNAAAADEPAPHDALAAARNALHGFRLFVLYFLVYAAYVGLSAFRPAAMSAGLFGVNVAVVFGFGLNLLAVVLSLVYVRLCRAAPAAPAAESAADRGRQA